MCVEVGDRKDNPTRGRTKRTRPATIVSHLPGGHLPPPNSDISHPQKKHLPGGQLPPPIFSFFFWLIFLGFFDLQLMEDIKDGKEEVLDEVVMEHIK